MGEIFPAASMPDRDWWSALWPDPEGVLRRIGVRPGMAVLDLCCGDGYFTARLAKIVGGHVYALDLDPGMIEQARVETALLGAAVRPWIVAAARLMAKLVPDKVNYVLLAHTYQNEKTSV